MIKSEKVHDVDYSQWLGKDYKQKQNGETKKCPTIVCNHMGWPDITVLMSYLWGNASFVGAEFIKDVPFVCRLMIVSESIFVPRGGS